MVKLAPCPFCAVELEESAIFSSRTAKHFTHPVTEGEPCIASSINIIVSDRDDDQRRAAAWNRRAAQSEPAAWQRFTDSFGWQIIAADDLEHYRAKGAALRPLFLEERTTSAGRWRVFEAIEHGWWGIEIEDDADADPILYSQKALSREKLEEIVSAHNATLSASGGGE